MAEIRADREEEGAAAKRPSLGGIAREFLRISLLGFGGPNAHLALMLDALVERRHWLDREHFLHLVAMTNLLPGPNSSEVAIHIGYTQRGWRGALVAGLAFLGPTFLLMVGLSILYFRLGNLPAVQPLFWGLKPVIVAVILGAGWRLGRTALEDPRLLPLALLGAAVALGPGRWQVGAMLLGAIVGWVLFGRQGRDAEEEPGPTPERGRTLRLVALTPLLALAAGAAGLPHLFLLMLGIGATLFGGGYVLVALLQPFAVERYGWLTSAGFLDGVALSQAVPGPISTLATFVGYAAAGVPGAAVATLGIYLPAFAAVLLVAPRLEHWRRRPAVHAALRGVSAVVAGAVLGTAIALAPAALPDPLAVLLLLAAAAAILRGIAPPWLILAGLAAGVARMIGSFAP
jgi:chromate transporter